MEFIEHASVTTPERVSVEYDVAGVGSRAVATLVDFLAILGMMGTVGEVLALTAAALPHWLGLPLLIVFFAAAPFAYFILFEWLEGSTPGKMAMRIRVVTDAGTPIGLRESAVRNLLRVIDFLPSLYILGGVVATCSTRSKRLGDMAAGTFCVRTERRERGRTQAQRGTGSFVEQVERGQVQDTASPAYLATVREFRRRHKELDPEVREELTAELCRKVAPYVERKPHISDERYLEVAERRLRRV